MPYQYFGIRECRKSTQRHYSKSSCDKIPGNQILFYSVHPMTPSYSSDYHFHLIQKRTALVLEQLMSMIKKQPSIQLCCRIKIKTMAQNKEPLAKSELAVIQHDWSLCRIANIPDASQELFIRVLDSGGSRSSSRRGRFFGRMNFKGDF